MRPLIIFTLFAGIFFTVSCEQCTRCSCSYTETTIIQTVNGEEEVVEEKTHYVWNDEDSAYFTEECVKGDAQFTIKDLYDQEEATSTLDNIDCTCTDF